jgi:hypothetical protein
VRVSLLVKGCSGTGTGVPLLVEPPGCANVDERSGRSQYIVAAVGRETRSRKQAFEATRITGQEPTEEPGGVAADEREVADDCEFANVRNAALLLAAHHRLASRQFSPSARRV